jgi:hypothetical protein
MHLEVISVKMLSTLSKWQAFSFIFSQGNTKAGWVEDDSHVAFGQKLPGDKERDLYVVKQQTVLLLPKFGAKSSQIFMQLLYLELTVWPARMNSL